MGIQVMIKRNIRQGHHAREAVPLILQLRAKAMHQPGYISGETLCDLYHPGECIVVSRWNSIEDWNRWRNHPDREKMEQQIEKLTGEKMQYRVYASMVPGKDATAVMEGPDACLVKIC